MVRSNAVCHLCQQFKGTVSRKPAGFAFGLKVARHDLVYPVVPVDGHRQPVAFAQKAAGMDDRGHTQDVIKRSEAETAATAELQAEVLGMAELDVTWR